MQVIETTYLTFDQKEVIYRIWNHEYSEKLTCKTLADFDSYLNNLIEPNHCLLVDDLEDIEGWAVTFTREHERWFVLILDRKMHGQGKGTLLLNKIKERELKICGWAIDHNNDRKQDGEPYSPPLKFYEKNGFIICSDDRLETEKLSAVKIVWEQKQNCLP
jgi:hypothetical protein